MRAFAIISTSLLLSACGGSSSEQENNPDILPEPTPTPIVTFFVADAPADSVTSVNVTFNSITLKSADDNDDDNSGLELPLLDESGEPTAMTIDLMNYQDGEQKLIIDSVEVPAGEYKSLIINTLECPQNQNGDTSACWVVDADGEKPLKTPSNKLRLGAITIAEETEQAFTIEFNLRSSLVSTANSASYNLKPHGIRIVNSDLVGKVSGTVDVNVLTAGEGCETVFTPDSDHGKIVYIYQGMPTEGAILADEFDPEEEQTNDITGVTKPYASDSITFDGENYRYSFAHLPAGEYTLAFSCSAVGDDSDSYDLIKIANPEQQIHTVTIEAAGELEQNFTEI